MTRRKDVLKRALDAFLAAQPGPEKERARDEALKQHEYLVPNTVSRFTNIPYGVETEDLEQAGRIALANALKHYNPDKRVNEKPVEFITYAIASIRKGVARCIHDSSWSKAAADNEKAINKAKAELEQEFGRPPTAAELAEQLGVSEKRLSDMWNSCGRNRPLYIHQSSSSGEDEDSTMQLEDVLSSGEPDLFERLIEKQKAEILLEIADSLRGNLREAALLLMQGYETKQIAQHLGVSSSRAGMIVSTLRERIIRRIMAEHADLFSEELSKQQPGLRPGRVRRRRRRPRMATLIC